MRPGAVHLALLALPLSLAGCLPAVASMATARTLRPGEGQVWIAVEPPGEGAEPGKDATPRAGPLAQVQVGVREGVTPWWEAGLRFSPAGVEVEQKLQLVRSPIDVAGVDVALAAGAGASIHALDEWDDVIALRLRAELPIALRLPDTSLIVVAPRALALRTLPAPDVALHPETALLVGASAALFWRLGAAYLVPEVTALRTVSGPDATSPLHRDPLLVRFALGFVVGG
ncbi:MAG TPA: hypothetical protein VLT47_13195 [Anaeromyxobacteraceae bacterium]|nr:hypothetical protein [Anaeromyxobacteraceae bacterium]